MPTSAKGIPDRSEYGDLSTLHEGDIATLVRQLHKARRAGLHEDLRIGTPSGLFSWAVPKQLPTDDSKRLAIQQPLHRWSYKDFEGRIGPGYGSGDVSKMEESPIVILKNSGDHIAFTRGDSKDAPIYDLVRTHDKSWMLFIRKGDQPELVRTYPKEHFKEVPMDKVPELIANGAVAYPKIDGAGALAYLGPKGVRVFGIRSNANGLKPEYSHHMTGLNDVKVPKDLQGKLLRGEIFGMRGGKAIPNSELSGILNSTVRNSAYKRRGDGIRLVLAALAVHDNGVDDYRADVPGIVGRLDTDSIVSLQPYEGKAALKLLDRIRSGKYPLTHEGLVLHQEGKRPVKAKERDDAEVVIRNIFRADTADGSDRAGGFEYSLPESSEVVGRVGTGFTHDMLRDMLVDPQAYIGRTARIHAQEQYPSGAYRAPGFLSLKED